MIIDKIYDAQAHPDILKIGVKSLGEYMPYYTICDDTMYISPFNISVFLPVLTDIKFYYKHLSIRFYKTKTYSEFLKNFKYKDRIRKYGFKVQGKDVEISSGHYSILDDKENILLILCCKNYERNQIFDNDVPIYKYFKLLVATEFLLNPIYKSFYKKVEKDLINSCYEKGISVQFKSTKSIDEELFSKGFEENFNSITELNNIVENDILSDFCKEENLVVLSFRDTERSKLKEIKKALFQMNLNSDAINSFFNSDIISNNLSDDINNINLPHPAYIAGIDPIDSSSTNSINPIDLPF
jgi:hypothetical protein